MMRSAVERTNAKWFTSTGRVINPPLVTAKEITRTATTCTATGQDRMAAAYHRAAVGSSTILGDGYRRIRPLAQGRLTWPDARHVS